MSVELLVALGAWILVGLLFDHVPRLKRRYEILARAFPTWENLALGAVIVIVVLVASYTFPYLGPVLGPALPGIDAPDAGIDVRPAPHFEHDTGINPTVGTEAYRQFQVVVTCYPPHGAFLRSESTYRCQYEFLEPDGSPKRFEVSKFEFRGYLSAIVDGGPFIRATWKSKDGEHAFHRNVNSDHIQAWWDNGTTDYDGNVSIRAPPVAGEYSLTVEVLPASNDDTATVENQTVERTVRVYDTGELREREFRKTNTIFSAFIFFTVLLSAIQVITTLSRRRE